MPQMSMLVAGGPRVKASGAPTRVAVKRIAEANPDVAVPMPMIHDREESPLQAPLAGTQGKFSAAKTDELLWGIHTAYSGVVSICPRERCVLGGSHERETAARHDRPAHVCRAITPDQPGAVCTRIGSAPEAPPEPEGY